MKDEDGRMLWIHHKAGRCVAMWDDDKQNTLTWLDGNKGGSVEDPSSQQTNEWLRWLMMGARRPV